MAATPIRATLSLAWPILVAQLAMMLMPITDTLMIGHYTTTDLAALALGNSVYITVFLTLSGVLQVLSPTFAHHHGGGRADLIRHDFQQGFWLALALGLIGWSALQYPQPLLNWTHADPEVLNRAIAYLKAIAWGLPAVMLYKVCSALLGATLHQRVIMWVSLAGVSANIPFNAVLIWGIAGLPGWGATGSGVATALAAWLTFFLAARYLHHHRDFSRLALFSGWQKPHRSSLWTILKGGCPIAFSLLVEISAFTLIALFVARLGAETIGGHRIAAQIAGVCYMLPLALGTATSILVGQACGARDFIRARDHAWQGTLLAAGLATSIGAVVLLARVPISQAFSPDTAVVKLASDLMIFIALYQFFDGVQTLGTFALRGYRVTLLPMVIHVACFWGIGIGGGYWLAFHPVHIFSWNIGESGAAGFWAASVASTVAAALWLGSLLEKVSRARLSDQALTHQSNLRI